MKLALKTEENENLIYFSDEEIDFILNLLHYAINMEKETYELAKEISEDDSEESISHAMDVLFDHKGQKEKEVIYNIIRNKFPKVIEMVNYYKGD